MIKLKIRKSTRRGREGRWVVDIHPCKNPFDLSTSYVTSDGEAGDYEDYPTQEAAEEVANLFLMKNPDVKPPQKEVRTFESGATRDTTEGKLSYVKALSPVVLQRYVQYLNDHRKQPDGSLRDFDNWKQGIPMDAYLDGLGRHFVAAWLLAQGFPAKDNHGAVTLEDTLCAIIFNASGWLHELVKE